MQNSIGRGFSIQNAVNGAYKQGSETFFAMTMPPSLLEHEIHVGLLSDPGKD